MRFLHTSDWHLGRIFYGIHLTDDQAHILNEFVKLAGESRPDVILISGDIYDRTVPPAEAVKLLDEVLSNILIDYKIPIILISGNHDSPERLGFGTRLLARQGLHLFGHLDRLSPVVLNDTYGPVYFCPLPYSEPSVVREILSDPEAADHERAMNSMVKWVTNSIPPGIRKVVIAHAFVTGGVVCESERPLSVGGTGAVQSLCFQPFNYAALGHLHRPQHTGSRHIRYAGSLLKYSFSEAGHRKSVTFVEMDGSGEVALEEIHLSTRRDVRRLEGFMSEILEGPRNGESRDDYLAVTLKDTGAILDAIGKLREVYPNILHIERPHLTQGGELHGPGGDHRQLNEIDLFSSFFEQVTGSQLTDEQTRAFAETVEALYR